MLNTMAENKSKKFYDYFDLFPEIMITYTMICDHDLREKVRILVKCLFLFLIIVLIVMKLLVTLLIIKPFPRIKILKKYTTTFSCNFFLQNMVKGAPQLRESFFNY